MAYHLKLIQPKELPADNLTSAEFKPWTNHLNNFLQQDVENFRFLKGGRYSTWLPASENVSNKRIIALHVDDPELLAIDAHATDNAAVKTAKKTRLLDIRNAQLGKLLHHITSFVHYTEADDIDQISKSIDWIFTYLRQHYNIEAKGSNLLKITEHTYKSGTSHQVFYKQFRSSWLNNLRKEGEVMQHKGGKVLDVDEILSPTFEDAIVLWVLEKIDPRLPKKVRKDYEHRLAGNTYLIDLQVTIFQSIPTMLEDLDNLDKQAGLNALAASVDKTPALSAIRQSGGRRSSQPTRGGRGGGGQRSGKRPWSKIFCHVCHGAGKPSQVFTSHTSAMCGTFNNRDRRDMYASLKAMDLHEDDDEGDDNWTVDEDDLEAEENQG
jgi:hypothetical protein